MKVLLTGGTGFIGNELGRKLVERGHSVVCLTRDVGRAQAKLSYPCELFQWSGEGPVPKEAVKGVDAVVNMIGEGVADKNWSKERKAALRSSRITATKDLAQSFKGVQSLKTFVSFSAVGYYGDRSNEVLDEEATKGEGFLADLCEDWESAGKEIKKSHSEVRLVIPRVGVVLGANQGFLDRLEPIFRSGVGGPLGSGKQFISWIHIEDLVRFLTDALEDQTINGIYNLTAPHPVSNTELTRELEKAFQVMAKIPAPAFVLKMVFGEMSQALLFSQRCVSSKRSIEHFKYPTLSEALGAIYGDLKKNEARFESYLWVPKKPEEVWDFFSSEKNLEEITPKNLNFRVIGTSTDQIEEGTLIDYRLRIHGVPASWRTRISLWNPPKEFVDEQLKGPYERWHHHHGFKELAGGTLLTDCVHFKLPLGTLGRIGGFAFGLNDVKKIFSYRAQVVAKKYHS